jgi:hypothetical protein
MHQPDFIRLCLELGVLRFGEFKLKSGRMSPYFFNAGLFNTGRAIAGLGRYYARAAASSWTAFCASTCSIERRPGMVRTSRPVLSTTSTSWSMQAGGMLWPYWNRPLASRQR